MAFGKSQLNYAIAPLVAMAAPFAAVSGSKIALNTIAAGTTLSSPGLVLGGTNVNLMLVEQDSIVAQVQAQITTATLTVVTQWQQSDDGINWVTLLPFNAASYVQWVPAGTGANIVTTALLSLAGFNPAKKYLRLAVLTGVATGGVADALIVAYSWRQRFTIPG